MTGQLHSDLGPGVASADDEDSTFPKLRRATVLARMQLDNGRIELGGKVWDSRSVIGPRGHHDVVSFEPKVTGGRDEPILLIEEPVDPYTGSNGEIEFRHVSFEIVCRLVLGGIREIGCRK
jgi:hypothetical protein